jgi:hypothetical protein
MNSSVTYWRELLVPSETLSLYFKVSEKVGYKDLVAALRFYDAYGVEILEIEALSYSEQFSRHFIYLRSPEGTVGDWIKAAIKSQDPVRKIEIEVIPWSNNFKFANEDVVLGVWAGEALQNQASGNALNFVAVQGHTE